MAAKKSVWGLDIGQCALKALKVSESEGEVQVDAFEVIEHSEILSQAEKDRSALIREALERLLAAHNLRGSTVVVAVPGQSSFTRFVKLPPVERKRIPDIVRFEAEQQIPFPIEEVIWQWQTFEDPDNPDVEVGIFAMKRGDVAQVLQYFTDAGIQVDAMQMAPLGLYNFMMHDRQLAEEGATLLADVGADKTDLVVADGCRMWTRTIQIGGNSFTEALVRAFKLSFDKAEKLKRSAASSKYARQIFQAMRPVFADLVQEVQRSIGYYTSLHRESRFQKLVGLGNGFRLPGLQKFLEQNLNIPVARVDSYNALNVSDSVSSPQFAEHTLSFAVAYGLALQGLGRAQVNTNLLPGEILRKRQWDKKRPWFAAAAAVLLACLAGPIYRAKVDAGVLEQTRPSLQKAERVVREINNWYTRWGQHPKDDQGKVIEVETTAQLRQKALSLFRYRNFWPLTEAMIYRAIQSVAADQPELIQYARNREQWVQKMDEYRTALGAGATPEQLAEVKVRIDDLEKAMKEFKDKPRGTRKVIVVEGWASRYADDLRSAGMTDTEKTKEEAYTPMIIPGESMPPGPVQSQKKAPAVETPRGFVIRVVARTQMVQEQAIPQLLTPLRAALTSESEKYAELSIVASRVELLPPLEGPTEPGKARPARPARPVSEGPAREPVGPGDKPKEKEIQYPDPLLPDESMGQDTRFIITIKLAVESDGLPQAEPPKPESLKPEPPKPGTTPGKTSKTISSRG